MTHSNSVKHVLLAVGLGAMVGACGGETMQEGPKYADIQKDLVALGCTASGCHNATASNKLKIDTTAGKEMDNYMLLLNQQLVIKGDATNSPLVKVPSTGMGPTVGHVKTLTGTKLTNWQTWINGGATF
jgi:hypothetical protein